MSNISIKSFFHFGDIAISNTTKKELYDYLKKVPANPQGSVGLISQLMYDTCPAEFVGRKYEMDSLDCFIKDDRKLLWWAVTGSAGKGKTRLAYEFAKKLNKHQSWMARIINWRSFVSYFTENDMYMKNTKKHLLIIIDYVFSYEKDIACWIEWLSQNGFANKKIRILLIEREDQKVDTSGRIKNAPWEEMFANATHDLMLIRRLKYTHDNINLNLSSITKEDAKYAVESYCKKRNLNVSDSKIENIILAAEKSSNNTISPLQLLLLTEYYTTSHVSKFSTNIYHLALGNIVNKELTALRRTFDITIEEQDSFDYILLLATIIGYISMDNCLLYALASRSEARLTQTISKVRDSHMCDKDNNGEPYICGLQPDLIGEYFVYTMFSTLGLERIKLILESIHRDFQNELSRFLLRMLEDNKAFAFNNERLDLMKKYLPEQYMTFILSNEEGKQIECEVLFTFESEENNKNYIVYTDNTIDAEGNTRAFASVYDPNTDQSKLLPIETEKEWGIIETILEELQQEASENGIQKDITEITEQIEQKLNGQ